MLTCFPSKAPKQFGKFQQTLKPFSISYHLSRVGSGITSIFECNPNSSASVSDDVMDGGQSHPESCLQRNI